MARRQPRIAASPDPFLREVSIKEGLLPSHEYPFSIPALRAGFRLRLRRKVTLFVGENGSGKSTLLEGIAGACGFGLLGGSRDQGSSSGSAAALADSLRLGWLRKISEGFFFRAESFFDFSIYMDRVGDVARYGGERPLLEQSHGESFLSLFQNRFHEGLFILDEPEAALSPQRQLAFLTIMRQLEIEGRSQFLIATHSPILLLYPGAAVISLDEGEVSEVHPEDTEHVRLTRDFLNAPERYFRALFDD